MKIAFLGDISLNDNYIELYKNGINPFEDIESYLNSSDYVIGNLESIAKGEKGENLLKTPRLTTTVETLNYLKTINLSLVTLAHNHIYDHLEDGFAKTVSFLEKAKIPYMGAGFSYEEAFNPRVLRKNGISIGFLNYVTYDTNSSLPEEAGVKLNYFNFSHAEKDICELKPKVDQVVLLLHWGGKMEGSMYPHIEQPKLARKLIDAGADLIIGHHTHTLQPYETYKGKHIFYSLGNLCFSDVIVDGKPLELDRKRTNPSIVLTISFSKTEYSIVPQWLFNYDGIIKLSHKRDQKLKQMAYQRSLIYKPPFWFLYFFYEKRVYPIIAYFCANHRNPVKQLFSLERKSFTKHLKRLVNLNKLYLSLITLLFAYL
jgi:hypothetical protein